MIVNKWPLAIAMDKVGGNANAKNNFLMIRIRKDVADFDAILAQEVYEWNFMALRSLPFLLAALLLVLFRLPTELLPFFGPMSFIIAANIPRWIPALRREMELRGHMIEVLVAVDQYKRPFGTKLAEEAGALTTYKDFRGWSREKITVEMLERERIAEEWLSRRG